MEYKVPTEGQIINYLKRNGYSNPSKLIIEEFVLSDNYARRFQYWECINNDYEYCDFLRWQHFEDVVKREITWEQFHIINTAFYFADLDIFDL